MTNSYPALHLEHAWQLAYQWVCARRRHYPANADIWHLRFHWATQGPALLTTVLAGRYRLSAMQVLGKHAIWSAQDALVLKWVALIGAPWLALHPCCEHGLGMGVVASRRRLHHALTGAGEGAPYTFVMRTDIRGYYQHIDKEQVLHRVVNSLPSPVCRDLIRQYLYYSVEEGGEFHTPASGICRGCALSPLIGAGLLYHIDADLAGHSDLYYARYMDDFIILARTRWRLRRAIATLRGHLAEGGFSLHPDKTQIGRLAKGVDWLGGWFTHQGRVGIAPRALQGYRTRSLRLYEQALRQGHSEEACQARVRIYRTRWRGTW
ncbi:reverse transcriptase domain-containing protein [Aeromonas dhakensis]|uniref:reverse transcriptase domain-containing protein n=1 Tax=Aeromonas dhakensis TaxID=196024 RepID=UPI0038CF34D6